MSSRSPVGAACPYCHFTIKSGVEVTSCDACGSPHHTECWAENEGCAVTGCSRYAGPAGAGAAATPSPPQGPTRDTAETAALPQGGQAPLRPRTPNPPAYAPEPGQPRTPQYAPVNQPSSGWGAAPPPSSGPSGDGGRGKWIALGAVIPLVVIVAVVIGYLIASPGGDDKKDDGDRNAAQVTKTDGKGGTKGNQDGSTTGPAPATNGGAQPAGGGSQGGTPPVGSSAADQRAAKKKQVAQQLLTIMAQSGRGRQMTRQAVARGSGYDAALTNRNAVLRKLDALEAADSAQRSAINTFRAAISASRSSVLFHQQNGSYAPTSYDATASDQKRLYCQKWSSSGMGTITGQPCDPEGI